MAAIIGRPAIRTTGSPLIAPGALGCLTNRYLPFDLARAFGQVPVELISIFLNRMPLRRIIYLRFNRGRMRRIRRQVSAMRLHVEALAFGRRWSPAAAAEPAPNSGLAR
jgi:hypothetical protein